MASFDVKLALGMFKNSMSFYPYSKASACTVAGKMLAVRPETHHTPILSNTGITLF